MAERPLRPSRKAYTVLVEEHDQNAAALALFLLVELPTTLEDALGRRRNLLAQSANLQRSGHALIRRLRQQAANAEADELDVQIAKAKIEVEAYNHCLLYTSPSPRDKRQSRMPSSA